MHVKKQRQEFSAWLKQRGIKFFSTNRISELDGAPSHLIVGAPPKRPNAVGVAVLFKSRYRKPKPAQYAWVGRLAPNWEVIIAYSVDDAVDGMHRLGFTETET